MEYSCDGMNIETKKLLYISLEKTVGGTNISSENLVEVNLFIFDT